MLNIADHTHTNTPFYQPFYRRTEYCRPTDTMLPFSALTLLVGQQEGPVKVGCWFVGGDILTEALHIL